MRIWAWAAILVWEVLAAVAVGVVIAFWTILSSADWGDWEGQHGYAPSDVVDAERLKLHAKARGIGFKYSLGTLALEGGVTAVAVSWARRRNKNAR